MTNKAGELRILMVQELAISFYLKFLGCPARADESKLESLSQLIPDGIPEDKNQVLQTDVTTDEIKWSLFSMKRNKALGPDGYSTHFLRGRSLERIFLLLSTPFLQVNY